MSARPATAGSRSSSTCRQHRRRCRSRGQGRAAAPQRSDADACAFELAALYGHNFGEPDESDSNDKTQNDLAGVELTFNALPGDIAGLTLKQAILYSFNGDDDGINGRTGLGLGLTP